MEGDDELTSDDDGDDHNSHDKQSDKGSGSDDKLSPIGNSEKTTPKFYSSRPSTARVLSRRASPTRRPKHSRTISGATMLYNPIGSPNLGTTTPPRDDNGSSEGEDRLPFVSTSVDQGTINRAALVRNLSLNPMSVPEIDGLYLSDRPLSKRRQRSRSLVPLAVLSRPASIRS
jgi:hypothetical protein